MLLVAILISILSGSILVFTRIFNFKMADKMGLFEGALINYIGGLLFSVLLLIFLKTDSLPVFLGIPTWAYFGGLLGVGVIVLSSYLTKRVSSFYLTLLIFMGQLGTGIIIDYIMSGEVSTGKIVGGILVAVGFSYNLYVDHRMNLSKEQIPQEN